MIKIHGTTIEMTRGDSLSVEIGIFNSDGTPYVPVEGDTLRFAMKSSKMTPGNKQFADLTPLLTKTISTTDRILSLVPSDTASRPFGTYIYDIQLTHSDGTVDTFIAEAELILRWEVD